MSKMQIGDYVQIKGNISLYVLTALPYLGHARIKHTVTGRQRTIHKNKIKPAEPEFLL